MTTDTMNLIALAVVTLLAIRAAMLMIEVAKLKKRLARSDGAMLSLFAVLRNTPPFPADKEQSFQLMRKMVNDWFDETMLGAPARRRKSYRVDRMTTFAEDGSNLPHSEQEHVE